jgi:hypothetical protein
MKKTPKVVPLEEPKYRLIAEDQNTHRIIFGIGSERMAIDLFSRITKRRLLPAIVRLRCWR